MENNNGNIEGRLRDVLTKVFTYFYYKLLNFPHLSHFFSSPEMFQELIRKQTDLMVDLLLGKEGAIKSYESVIHLHHQISLPQDDFVDAMELVKRQLLNLAGKGKLEISPQEVESLFHQLIQLSFKVYFAEDIRELEDTWEKFSAYVPEIASSQIELLKLFEQLCTDKDGRTEIQRIETLSCSEASKYFSSADFLLKSYSAKDISLALQKINEELYNHVCYLIKYVRNRDYRSAYRTWSCFSEKAKLLLLYFIFLNYKWETNKENILGEFLIDPLFEEKLFGLVFIPAETDKLALEIFKYFSSVLINTVKSTSYGLGTAFLYEDRDREIHRCYVFYITEQEKKNWLREAIKTMLEEAKVKTCGRFLLNEEQLGRYVKASVVTGDLVKLSKISREDFSLFMDTIEETIKEKFPDKVIVELADISETVDEFQEIINAVKLLGKPEKENYIKLFGQPIVELENNKIECLEVLTRVIFPNGKIITPYKFLKVVKKLKSTSLFDGAVIRKLKKFLKDYDGEIKYKIFVNLYPTSCYNREVLEELREAKEMASKRNVELVTEVIEIEDIDITRAIDSLSALGFKVAIDDFGSGYSNFERVAQFVSYENLKFIKIDGQLVRKIKDDKVFLVIVKNIASLAEELNKRVVYEFVEDEGILSALKEISKGNALGQGYFLGKPEPLEKLL